MKCALLDLDGTLIKTDYRKYLIEIPSKLLISWRVFSDEEKAFRAFRARVREIIREQILSENYIRAFDWDYVINEALKSFGVEERLNALSLLMQALEDGRTRLYDDALPVVRELRKRRKVCVMTGGLSKYQVPIMERIGIIDEFDDVITTDRLGVLKIRPEAFLRAMSLCKCDKAFHVGDSISHDIFGAKSAGLGAILVARDWSILSGLHPLERPLEALRMGLIREKMMRDIVGDVIELKIPDAIVINLRELPPLCDVL